MKKDEVTEMRFDALRIVCLYLLNIEMESLRRLSR